MALCVKQFCLLHNRGPEVNSVTVKFLLSNKNIILFMLHRVGDCQLQAFEGAAQEKLLGKTA